MVIREYDPQITLDINARTNRNISNLERVRISRGMSRAQLAEESGISIRVLQGYEYFARDINGSNMKTLLNLCIALNCRLEDIIEGDEIIEKAKIVRNIEAEHVSCPEQYMPAYPQNLLQDIFGDPDAAQSCVDSENTLEHLYRSLPNNWGDILKLKYRDNFSFKEIGVRYQVTRGRSSQIVRNALQKLKIPENITCLRMGIDAYRSYCEIIAHNERVKIASRPLSGIPIQELDLSGRAYNALMRAGYDTIAKVADLNFDKLMALKCMGEPAANEVLTKIRAYLVKRNGFKVV